mmetsp:Transcript_19170/g.40244  ORF Transcript_19170/g.40244 Transcript_19170/m.40244 type:complete len:276 (+) Transcript_19170:1370-2197(+)
MPIHHHGIASQHVLQTNRHISPLLGLHGRQNLIADRSLRRQKRVGVEVRHGRFEMKDGFPSNDGRDGHDHLVVVVVVDILATKTRTEHGSKDLPSPLVGPIAQTHEEMSARVEDVSPIGRGHRIVAIAAHVEQRFSFDEMPLETIVVQQRGFHGVHLPSSPRGVARIRDACHAVRHDDDVFDEGTVGVVFQGGEGEEGLGEEGLQYGLVAGVLVSTFGEGDGVVLGGGIVVGGEGVAEGVGDLTRDGEGVCGSSALGGVVWVLCCNINAGKRKSC